MCARRYHRSDFSAAAVRPNRALARSRRRRSYAVDAATSSRPIRTVCVTPRPLASCALLRRSAGTSIVIFRLDAIVFFDENTLFRIIFPPKTAAIAQTSPHPQDAIHRQVSTNRALRKL